MSEYVYRGFKIVYTIETDETDSKLYKAEGYAECLLGKNTGAVPRKFHTVYHTLSGVKAEIKKLVQDYIDFEWKEFHKMDKSEKI